MDRPERVEKRNRLPKSCEPCRQRKLRCDRQLPCSSCMRRAKEAQCQYASNLDRHEKHNKKENVAERLSILEDLITTMAQREKTKGSMSSSSNLMAQCESLEDVPNQGESNAVDGKVDIHSDFQSNHIDSNHWSSILENIKSLRDEWSPPSPNLQASTVSSATPDAPGEATDPIDINLCSSGPLNLEQILTTLPLKPVCDSLVSHYFRAKHTIMPILHPAKFQQEYESFWEAPAETPIVWIGLLFAILGFTAGIHELSEAQGQPQSLIPPAKVLSKSSEQCLVLGNYVASDKYAVEALLVHLGSCFLRSKDSDVNFWFLMGSVIRLAICKGYHRDSTKIPRSNISAFDAEMRRRVWITIFQVDALMSFQFGLPSMIPSDSCDAQLPRNLDYPDLYPEISILPPSRPLSDSTPILYTIAKAPVMSMFKRAVDHTRSLKSLDHKETMTLDTEIRRAYNDLITSFKYKPLQNSIVDEPGIIVQRITIEMLHLKSIIILHRQYINHRKDNQAAQSRTACLEAARRVLERQVELHHAVEPGGQLYDVKWMVTTLTMNDIILAAMVICLDLTVITRRSPNHDDIHDDEFNKGLSAIRTAHGIWAAADARSIEVRTVTHALESTIQRITGHEDTHASTPSSRDLNLATTDTISPHITWSAADAMDSTVDPMDLVDWSIIDCTFHDQMTEDLDLDVWLKDSAGPASYL